MVDKRDDAFLEQNIKGMMMTLIARWNPQMDDLRAETEFAEVRPADICVFTQFRGRTVKLSEVHREMGFSRQAVQQAVDRLVRHDMIVVRFDPRCKRDKLVSITEKGQRWRTFAAEQIRKIETAISGAIGEDAKESLRDHLIHLGSEV